jgi:predicted anti-sigma-YlaC factor YlaD
MRSLVIVPALTVAVTLGLAGCSLKTIAMRSLADTVAEPGGVYNRDDDPELVKDAIPVMLKIMEQLADGLPDHKGIHLALTRTFTAYSVGFIGDEGDRLNETNVERARVVYARAKRMSLRARGYGLKGLEIAVPGFTAAFNSTSREARAASLAKVQKADVALLYWTGAALGSAISVAKDDMALVGELPKVEQLMKRAIELDEAFDEGALHEFYISYEGAKDPKAAAKHLQRARELSKNKKLAPLVSYAEAVCVETQNKKEFTRLLNEVVAFDADADAEHRLVNTLAQRRARWLLSRTSDLFAE